MIQISGTVVGDPSGTPRDISTCLLDCEASPTCFMVYSNANGECISLTVDSAYQVNKTSDERFVGFKVDAEVCPQTYQTADYTVTMPNGFIYQWTRNDTAWRFTGCRKDWKNFQRFDRSLVCMKTFTAYYTSFNDSITQCSSLNSSLAGLASMEESQWVYSQLPSGSVWQGFWVGGVRDCVDTTTWCRTFKWIDGFTTGSDALASSISTFYEADSTNPNHENCLTVARTQSSAIFNDCNCVASNNLILGYVCGYIVGG